MPAPIADEGFQIVLMELVDPLAMAYRLLLENSIKLGWGWGWGWGLDFSINGLNVKIVNRRKATVDITAFNNGWGWAGSNGSADVWRSCNIFGSDVVDFQPSE